MDKFNDISRWISESLRYLLSGGVAILLLCYVSTNLKEQLLMTNDKEAIISGKVLLMVFTIGYTTYNFHRALLFPIFNIIVMCVVRSHTYLKHYSPAELKLHVHCDKPSKSPSDSSVCDILKFIDVLTDVRIERSRYEATKPSVGALARHLERWSSSVHALYSSFLTTIVIFALGHFNVIDDAKGLTLVLILSLLFLAAGLIHHYRYLKEELRLGASEITRKLEIKVW